MPLFNKKKEIITYKPITHIAFIMDGNGRWAKKRMMPRSYGHHEGVKRIKETLYLCLDYNIKVMTLFCFSTENWKRDKKEIDYLFSLFDEFFKTDIVELNQKEFERKISLTNKSSIACLFQFKKLRILFLGDSDPEEIVESLTELGYSKNNKLKVEFCKIAHHASRHNTSNELIQILDCSNYIISTQKTNDGRPSKECLSRIICNSEKSINFYCNYKLDWNNVFSEEEFLKYGMKFFLLDEQGIDVGEK